MLFCSDFHMDEIKKTFSLFTTESSIRAVGTVSTQEQKLPKQSKVTYFPEDVGS